MKWFYSLKRAVRIVIAIVSWLPLVVFAVVISGAIGESGENMQGWQAVLVLIFLAVGVAFTVFAFLARVREQKTTQANKVKTATPITTQPQARSIPYAPTPAAAPRPAGVPRVSYNIVSGNSARTAEGDPASFVGKPEFIAKLTCNGSSEYQNNITSCAVGDSVLLDYDDEKEAFLCISSGGEIGYITARAMGDRRGEYLIKIAEVPYNEDTHKYAVVVAAYAPKTGSADINFPIHTKIRGVTFAGRQAYLSASKAGDVLKVRHAPTSEYPNTIAVINGRTGKTLGNIGGDLAESLLAAFGAGCTFEGEIVEITGGSDGQNYGCNIDIIVATR